MTYINRKSPFARAEFIDDEGVCWIAEELNAQLRHDSNRRGNG